MAVDEQATRSRRNKPSPQRISHQIARAMQAHAAVEEACRARTLEIQRAERRIAAAVQAATRETARLAATCGSIQTTGAILGLEPDEVRHLIRRAQQSERLNTQRRAQRRSSARHPHR